jgi:hypothetical protein
MNGFETLPAATFSVGQGLSTAAVTSVLAAKDGSVWLGTLGSLNRWNHLHQALFLKMSAGAQHILLHRQRKQGLSPRPLCP